MNAFTIGVEEEYFLLHPVTGQLLPRAEQVRASAGLQPALEAQEVQYELLRCQLEVATPVCHDLEEVGGHLLRLRHTLAAAAEEQGCRLAACGTAPFRPSRPVPVTATRRYHSLEADAPQLTREQLICGMHVHIGIPDRHTAVTVLNRLRPWLPVLTALGANSPLWNGTDTGFASWRTIVFDRWPVSGIPPEFADADDYGRRIRTLVDNGIIRDQGQVYWQARLSERYPTIEIRATDVQLRPDEAVMLAGLIRALAATAAGHPTAPLPSPTQEGLAGAAWHAARHGITDQLHDPVTGRPHKAGDIIADLLKHTLPALQETGDDRQVTALLHRLLREGTGADRQRRALAADGPPALLRTITDP